MMLMMLALGSVAAADWSTVDTILQDGISQHVYPGCVALVADENQVYYSKAFGNYTFGVPPPRVPSGSDPSHNPPMTVDTLFDLASLTKIFATTTATAVLFQQGYIDLDTPLGDASLLGSDYNNHGKDTITVRNCLLHNAGFPPDPIPNFWAPAFPCPETNRTFPQENFSCRSLIHQAVLDLELVNPVGSVYVYSDLSMITLMFALGNVIRNHELVTESQLLPSCTAAGTGVDAAMCYYEAFLRVHVYTELGLKNTGFLPEQSRWGDCAPAENFTNTGYPNQQMQGQVSDGNAYTMGGIAGHAGLFSNALDLLHLMRVWTYPGSSSSSLLNAAVVKQFTTEFNHSQSSRALGWNVNDPTVFDYGTNQVCGPNASPLIFMHTGYTGTMACGAGSNTGAPYLAILLTNRVYPTDTNGSDGVNAVRRSFGDQVASLVTTGREIHLF